MVALALPDVAREFRRSPSTVTQALRWRAISSRQSSCKVQAASSGGKLGDQVGHWQVFVLGPSASGVALW